MATSAKPDEMSCAGPRAEVPLALREPAVKSVHGLSPIIAIPARGHVTAASRGLIHDAPDVALAPDPSPCATMLAGIRL